MTTRRFSTVFCAFVAVLFLVPCRLDAAQTARAYVPSLFVSDAQRAVVSRFELKNNLPVTPAAGRLQLASVARHVAVGPGVLFVSYNSAAQVDVFASTATGHAHPLRSLLLSAPPSGIAVDPAGYLYVAGLIEGVVDIYAPGAHGHATPIAFVGAGIDTPITYVTVDQHGRLFFVNTDSDLEAFVEVASPLKDPVFVRTVFQNFRVPLGAAAVDEWHEAYLLTTEIDAYSPSACCLGYPVDRVVGPQSGSFVPTGIALRGRYAFVINSAGNAVETYDVTLGLQTPLSVIKDAKAPSPLAIASDR